MYAYLKVWKIVARREDQLVLEAEISKIRALHAATPNYTS
jgi:hypothetical protein